MTESAKIEYSPLSSISARPLVWENNDKERMLSFAISITPPEGVSPSLEAPVIQRMKAAVEAYLGEVLSTPLKASNSLRGEKEIALILRSPVRLPTIWKRS